MKISRKNKVPNNNVLSRCSCNLKTSIVAERTIRWAGHLQKMPAERLPKTVFDSELAEGTRSVGRPRKDTKTIYMILSITVVSTLVKLRV